MYFGKGIEPVEHASLAGQTTEARDRLPPRKINVSECFCGIKWLVATDPTGERMKQGSRGKETPHGIKGHVETLAIPPHPCLCTPDCVHEIRIFTKGRK